MRAARAGNPDQASEAAQELEESKEPAANQGPATTIDDKNMFTYLNRIDLFSIEDKLRESVSAEPGFFVFYVHHACREPCSM